MSANEDTTEAVAMQKHRTVGISMSPTLEQRAKARAEALGLKFSPYVTLCVEAELKGFSQIVRDDTLDIESAMHRAREYMMQKTASIDLEDDVEGLLRNLATARPGASLERFARLAGIRVDFLLTIPLCAGQGSLRIAIECRNNVRQHYALTLGQGLLLRASPELDAVVLLVPYLRGFDEAVLAQFRAHDIHASTPDTLAALLERLCR